MVKQLLAEISTIVFSPGQESAGFRLLVLKTKRHMYIRRNEKGENCYGVEQSDLELLDRTGIAYEVINNQN
ncbi:MAG: hypothetical protein Q7R92_03535 [bacterium]|nr:hypothetical protein [bacterium]